MQRTARALVALKASARAAIDKPVPREIRRIRVEQDEVAMRGSVAGE
jgi:hypothetical protein